MQGMNWAKGLLCFCAMVCMVLAQPEHVRGQIAESPKTSAQAESLQKVDLSTVASALKQLQSQVHDLSAEVKTLRMQQETAKAESSALRMELEAAKSQVAGLSSPRNNIAETSGISSDARAPTTDERITKLEENQQLADGKIAEQSQTKVESASKYRVRLSGIVLFNLFGNQGTVLNQDVPELATKPGVLSSDGSFGGSLRQSQIGIQGFGPTIAGAKTSAEIQFDFAGGFPETANGVSFGVMRLRTGTIRFDWEKTSVIAGQDSLFIAPLSPTSIATLAIPPLAYSGNLWTWTPQVRVEHHFTVSDSSSFLLQGGILDSLTGDLPPSSYDRYPSWGEESKQPAYAARLAWTKLVRGENITVGVGGYYNRQFWGYARRIDGWAGTIDLSLPISKQFEFTGQFYRGRAIGGLGGAIGQSVHWEGSLVDPEAEIYGINSLGGWAQLKYRATPKLQFNGAFGQDNPYSSELREFGGLSIYYDAPISKNQSAFVNFLYQPRSDIVLSLEYKRLKTFALDSTANAANIVNFSVGYLF